MTIPLALMSYHYAGGISATPDLMFYSNEAWVYEISFQNNYKPSQDDITYCFCGWFVFWGRLCCWQKPNLCLIPQCAKVFIKKKKDRFLLTIQFPPEGGPSTKT